MGEDKEVVMLEKDAVALEGAQIELTDLPNIIASQFNTIEEMEKKVSDSLQKADKAKKSAADAKNISAGHIFNKDLLEQLQQSTINLADAQTSIADVQNVVLDYQKQLATITKYLFGLGASNIALNRTIVREIVSRLEGANGAAHIVLSDLAKQELYNVVSQLKAQEDITQRTERLESKARDELKKNEEQDAQLQKQAEKDTELGVQLQKQAEKSEKLDARLQKQAEKDTELGVQLQKQAEKSEKLDARLQKQAEKDTELGVQLQKQAEKSEKLDARLQKQAEKDTELGNQLKAQAEQIQVHNQSIETILAIDNKQDIKLVEQANSIKQLQQELKDLQINVDKKAGINITICVALIAVLSLLLILVKYFVK